MLPCCVMQTLLFEIMKNTPDSLKTKDTPFLLRALSEIALGIEPMDSVAMEVPIHKVWQASFKP